MKDNKSFKDRKRSLDFEERASIVYERQKAMMNAVLGIIPFAGDYLTEKVDSKFENYQTRKREEFIKYLSSCREIITPKMVSNEAFIINLLRTAEMVDRLSGNEKVVYYANIIRNGYFVNDMQISNDIFDEYISILNELSYREIQYLCEFANRARKKQTRVLDKKEWVDYCNYMREKDINTNPGFVLKRLERTGLVKEIYSWVEINGGTLTFVNPEDKEIQDLSFKLQKEYDNFEMVVLSRCNEESK